jgi:hypothetical protein
MVVYNCEACIFSTIIKQHYQRHLSTNKHLLTQKVNPKSTLSKPEVNPKGKKSKILVVESSPVITVQNKNICKYCDTLFSCKQSMYRHIKYTCHKNKDEDLKELVRLLNIKLEQQGKQIQSQARQIEKLMGKLEINGSFNTTNIQNITLLSYKDTDTSHIKDIDYIICIKKVCLCVVKLIEKIHFNPDKPENKNIYISNMKDKYLLVYEKDNWVLKNKNREIDKLYEEKELMLEEWLEEHKDPELQAFFDKYLNNKKNSETIDMINEELRLMMYNKRNRDVVLP